MSESGSHEDELSIIGSVLESMQQVVQTEGGAVSLQSYDAEAGRLVVGYKLADAGDCSDCAIDPVMLQQFIQESLRAHGLDHDDVVVETVA